MKIVLSYRCVALVCVILASLQPVGANLVAHYPMDEGNGMEVYDVSGNNNDGVLTGAFWVEGISGSALDFDGAGGHAEIANSDSLDIRSNEITIASHFKLTNEGDYGAFVFKNCQYSLEINSQGRLSFSLYKPSWSEVNMSWSDRITDTEWHHTAAVYDGAEMAIYLDGTKIASMANSGDIQQRTSDVWIGSQIAGLNQFDGRLDDVRIYDHALTSEEIAAIIPEPATLVLLGFGGSLLLIRRRN